MIDLNCCFLKESFNYIKKYKASIAQIEKLFFQNNAFINNYMNRKYHLTTSNYIMHHNELKFSTLLYFM